MINHKTIPKPVLPGPAAAYFWDIDSTLAGFVATGGSWAVPPVAAGSNGSGMSTVWFRPPDRDLVSGDILKITPNLYIRSDASTDLDLFFRAAIVDGDDGSVIRGAGQGNASGIAGWTVRRGTVAGARDERIGPPIYHRVKTADISADGGVYVTLQYNTTITAGTYQLINSEFFSLYDPAALYVEGPYEPIDGTCIVTVGQSLAPSVTDGDISDQYIRQVHAALLANGHVVGHASFNSGGSTYGTRDGYAKLIAAAGIRYKNVIVIDDGGTSDIDAGTAAATILTSMETAADAYRAQFDTGQCQVIKLTVPDASTFDATEDTVRTTLNASILANANSKFDATLDLESIDAGFGDYTDTSIFGDGLHFTSAAHALVGSALATTIEALL